MIRSWVGGGAPPKKPVLEIGRCRRNLPKECPPFLQGCKPAKKPQIWGLPEVARSSSVFTDQTARSCPKFIWPFLALFGPKMAVLDQKNPKKAVARSCPKLPEVARSCPKLPEVDCDPLCPKIGQNPEIWEKLPKFPIFSPKTRKCRKKNPKIGVSEQFLPIFARKCRKEPKWCLSVAQWWGTHVQGPWTPHHPEMTKHHSQASPQVPAGWGGLKAAPM